MSRLSLVQRQALMAREVELERGLRMQRARRGLLNFIRYTKPDYEVNWHHKLLCQYLNQIVDGDIKRLIVTMPPRHGKTESVSIRLPAYMLGRDPNTQVICATYNADYAKKINRDIQRVFENPSYQELFPDSRLNERNVRTVSGSAIRNADMFELVGARGYVKTTSLGGPLTGFGGNLLLCDDYCKNYETARSATYRESAWDWWTTTFTTRALKDAAIIICATRWHEGDLIGRVLEQSSKPGAAQWTVLNLPAVCENPKEAYDPREIGEALWPSHYGNAWLAQKRSESERSFISMYQQRPAPQEGNIIRTTWWKFWRELPTEIDLIIASADLSFSNTTGKEDFTVITVWARAANNFYLVDMVRDRMGWLDQKAAMLRVIADYPDLNAFYIENAALGAALIQEARQHIPGVVAITPKGSKETRLEAVSSLIQAGNVYLPEPESTGIHIAEAVIAEAAVFPNGKNDDICDSLSMALAQMRSRHVEFDFTADAVDKPSLSAMMRRVG